jgi:uncharacterized protein (TIGR00251 family)
MSCRLRLRVVPNAKRSECVGRHGDAVKVKISAPALEGRANEALIEFLADALDIGRKDIALVSGEKSRDKMVAIEGLDEAEVLKRLL